MSVSLNNAAVIAALIALVGVFITQIVSIALDQRCTRLTRELDDLRARETRELEAQRVHEAENLKSRLSKIRACGLRFSEVLFSSFLECGSHRAVAAAYPIC